MPASLIVALWWFSLKPSDDRNWQPDNAETASADINGDHVTIHNFRNCSYITENDYTCQWETRSFDLANLSGADIFITWWGPTLIAHPIVSFDFGAQGHVPISIETRDVVGQSYSAIRGFFRQYELAYIVSDERDVVRLRTNFRKDEEVYIFRTTVRPELDSKDLSGLPRARKRAAPTARVVQRVDQQLHHQHRRVGVPGAEVEVLCGTGAFCLNGKMDEMMYEHGRPRNRRIVAARAEGAGPHQRRGEGCRR